MKSRATYPFYAFTLHALRCVITTDSLFSDASPYIARLEVYCLTFRELINNRPGSVN